MSEEKSKEEKVKDLEGWVAAVRGEIDVFTAEMQVPLDKKHKMEKRLSERMGPVMKLIAKKQKNINEANARIRMIEGKMKELLDESNTQEIRQDQA